MATHSDLIAAEAAHAGFINRVGRGNANKVIEYLKEADAYIASRLAREGETIRNQSRLLAVQKDIRSRLGAIYSKWEKVRQDDLLEIIPYESDFQVRLLDKLTLDVDFKLPDDQQVLAAALREPLLIGRGGSALFTQKMLDQWKPQQISMTNGAIQTGFSLGQTTQQISRQIRNEVLTLSRRDSDAIVITATNHLSTVAKAKTYAENDDIVIGYRLIATLDTRTTNQCKAWDQTVILNDADYKPMPPLHFGCRTTTTPELSAEFAKFDKGATRASKGPDGGGKVSSTEQYYDWLKKQPASFQNDALGKERGMIFRNSGLTPEEFKKASVDQLGRPLTIAGMAQRDERIKDYLQ
jgi:SPP1 gp7 family putative phage head morphogenesis protein